MFLPPNPKFHRFTSRFYPISLRKQINSHLFHQFAPSQRLRKPSNGDGGDCPNLHHYKDWLSHSQVIRIFQTLKNPNFTLPLFAQLSSRKDYRPTESLYTTIINKLATAADYDGIEAIMERIKVERKCRLSELFFRNVIKIYGHSAGRINKAIELLFDMPHYKCWPSVTTFNLVLHLLVTSKQFEIIHEVYAAAPKLGIEIDACCLNIIIRALCHCGEIEAAYKVLDEFPEQKCVPNVRSYSTIMHGLCDHGRVDEAISLLNRMEMEGVEMDAIVFNILISGLRKQGRVVEGVEMFDKMMAKGCKPNQGSYQEVLYCLLDAKKYSEAKNFMGKMMEKGINPSFESYKMAIKGFCDENSAEDVEWMLKQMVGNGFAPKMGMWKQIVRCMALDNDRDLLDRVTCEGSDEVVLIRSSETPGIHSVI